ncbi:MAG: DUF255 domain-containing protein [Dehalococcoidia bacterium]
MASDQHPRFHFSPRPNRAHEIRWREWGPEAFDEAQRDDKPIVLGISAVWCHWCHVMDETSYSDEQIIQAINERFVPVRVDNDQRPDINARYNMGGWPTTAFLTPDGEVLAGMTYVPPDQMRQVLDQLSEYYRENKDEIGAKVTDLRERRRAAVEGMGGEGELNDQVLQDVVAAINDVYDPVHGGFGQQPKFPHTDAIDLLLYAHLRRNDADLLHMARKTLEKMAGGGVFDHVWGGFFRYATNRDWSVPHFEKMLEDNALLLRNVLRLYRLTGDDAHAAVARRVIEYLDAWLSDSETGAFYGSQDADEEFYALDAEARAAREAPYVDRTVYTSWNALAASAYLEASWTLDDDALRDRALRALDFLWQRMRSAGEGMYRYFDGEPHQLGLLGDQVTTAHALLDAYEGTGDAAHLDRALELAALLEERFADEAGGGFFDTSRGHDSLGRLDMRQKPLNENAAAALLFLRLERFTHERRYAETAERTLAHFAGQHQGMGHFAAAYARAVDTLLHPPADVKLVGPGDALGALHRAALWLRVPDRAVQLLDPSRDGDRLASLAMPSEPSPAAYVCYGTACSAPARTVEELEATVEQMRALADSARPGELTAVADVDAETAD